MNYPSRFLCNCILAFALFFSNTQKSYAQAATHLNFDGVNDAVSLTATGFPTGALSCSALNSATSNWESGSNVFRGSIIPTAPAVFVQSFCKGPSQTVANLSPAPGSFICWYNLATSSKDLAPGDVLATGTYDVDSPNVNGCQNI